MLLPDSWNKTDIWVDAGVQWRLIEEGIDKASWRGGGAG